jgi:hypothetical protein
VRIGTVLGSLVVLVIGLLLDGTENIAHGQNNTTTFDPLLTNCVIHVDDHLIVLDLRDGAALGCTSFYVNQGWEIKAVSGVFMWLQK